jgi:hypothetical protein
MFFKKKTAAPKGESALILLNGCQPVAENDEDNSEIRITSILSDISPIMNDGFTTREIVGIE